MANYRPEGLAGPRSAPYTTSKSKVTPYTTSKSKVTPYTTSKSKVTPLHHIQVQRQPLTPHPSPRSPPYTTPKSKVTPIIPHSTSLHDT